MILRQTIFRQTIFRQKAIIIIPIIKHVLFVNSAVLSLDAYINSETIVIGHDNNTTTEMMMSRFLSVKTATVNRIGFAFHFSGEDDDFLNQDEPFFTDSDLGESVETFSPKVQFMLDLLLIGGITHVDFLACNTLQSDKWRIFYQLLQLKTGVVVGASDNNTGNLLYGGDWIMESTHEEVGQIYFTSAIENWASLLAIPSGLNTYYHTFYTMNLADTNAGGVMTRTIYNNTGTLLDTQDISFGEMNISTALTLMDGGGTNPYTIGIVDSSLNKISMDIAYCGVYTKALTPMQQTKLMTHVNTTYKEPHTYMTAIYTVTVSDELFVLKNQANVIMTYPISLSEGSVYMFDQSDASNQGSQLLVFSSTQMSNTALVGVTTTASGTPGYDTNAYTVISTTTAVAAAYTYYTVIYFMSVVTNNVGNLVFAVSTTGQSGQYRTQQDLSFGAGANVTFDVSHPSIANKYILRFGTTRNGVANETIVTRTANKVTLFIPSAYTGTNIYYYSDLPIVSAYETPVITLRGNDMNGGFQEGVSSGLSTPYPTNITFVNAGIGMTGISSDGKRVAYSMKNNLYTLGVVYDCSINNTWVRTTKNSGSNSLYSLNYQFNTYLDSGGLTPDTITSTNYRGSSTQAGDFLLNDAGTICAMSGYHYDGSGKRGGLVVYDLSANDNTWRIRGNPLYHTSPLNNATTNQWLARSYDTDYTFDTLVAGSNLGNYVKIYTYNSVTRLYTLKQDIIYSRASTDRFGFNVRMNKEGTKVIAVANWNNDQSAYYAKIYTSTDRWNTVSSVDLSVNNIFGTPKCSKSFLYYQDTKTFFISKALDLYLSVDTNNNTNVYALDSSSGIATLRNTIPNCNFFGSLETSQTANGGYSYVASLSGNGNRIVIIGGWIGLNIYTNGFNTRIYDYYPATNSWIQSGITFNSTTASLVGMVPPSPGNNTWFGTSVNMSYDGCTIAIGDPHANALVTGANHIIKCVTPQTFTYNS